MSPFSFNYVHYTFFSPRALKFRSLTGICCTQINTWKSYFLVLLGSVCLVSFSSVSFYFSLQGILRFERLPALPCLWLTAVILNSAFQEIEICSDDADEPTSSRRGRQMPADVDKVERVRDEVDKVKDIMVANIEALLERGERLELLVDKTEHLSNSSVAFKQAGRNLARKMWWQHTK